MAAILAFPTHRARRPVPVEVPARDESIEVTLLDLVTAIARETDDDHEVVATVIHMLKSGSVRLCGNFCGSDPRDLES